MEKESPEWPWVLNQENLEQSWAVGEDVEPATDDPRRCAHAVGFRLNKDALPTWLLEAVNAEGVMVSAPEIPDPNQQVFRTDGYLDWLKLADDHRDELEILNVWSPTTEALLAIEMMRSHGYNAWMTGMVFLLRVDAGTPVYGVEVADVYVPGFKADVGLNLGALVTRMIDAGRNRIPHRDRAWLDVDCSDAEEAPGAAWSFL